MQKNQPKTAQDASSRPDVRISPSGVASVRAADVLRSEVGRAEIKKAVAHRFAVIRQSDAGRADGTVRRAG